MKLPSRYSIHVLGVVCSEKSMVRFVDFVWKTFTHVRYCVTTQGLVQLGWNCPTRELYGTALWCDWWRPGWFWANSFDLGSVYSSGWLEPWKTTHKETRALFPPSSSIHLDIFFKTPFPISVLQFFPPSFGSVASVVAAFSPHITTRDCGSGTCSQVEWGLGNDWMLGNEASSREKNHVYEKKKKKKINKKKRKSCLLCVAVVLPSPIFNLNRKIGADKESAKIDSTPPPSRLAPKRKILCRKWVRFSPIHFDSRPGHHCKSFGPAGTMTI